MKDPSPPTSAVHPDSALLEYLEGLLSPQDEAVIEEHLKACSDCTSRLEELKELTATLSAEKEAFCPEAWQLFRYADAGEDTTGRIAQHLDHCSLCREEVEALRRSCLSEEVLPDKVRNAVHKEFSHTARGISPERSGLFTRFIERWLKVFLVPVTALGTVAAIALFLVLIYPWGHVAPVVGLSPVIWDPASALLGNGAGLQKRVPSPGIGRLSRPRMAIVLRFKGLPEPVAQEWVDDLYWALKPDEEAARAAEFVNPAQIKQALEQSETMATEANRLAEQLYADLGASRVVVITVAPHREKFRVDAELVDAKTSRTLATTTVKSISQADLPGKLRDSVRALLAERGVD